MDKPPGRTYEGKLSGDKNSSPCLLEDENETRETDGQSTDRECLLEPEPSYCFHRPPGPHHSVMSSRIKIDGSTSTGKMAG